MLREAIDIKTPESAVGHEPAASYRAMRCLPNPIGRRWQGLLPFHASPRQALFCGKTRRSPRRAVILR
ncbi:hypothetical protein [Salinisphaera japonica]|uniref:hypothetical protein n=1 Tax=Salinisphaera japonica TaxID=1304270 RepID=UPI00160F4B6B|nr:hypothetical protein [Salinisphaera japonica]|tara:strand:- start:380 stop:583 length:204 start_codon:yes stop_codon:yes gene_type:complete